MEYVGTIKYDLVELSTWKIGPAAPADYNEMSELLAEIVQYRRRYDGLSHEVKADCASIFTEMALEFVNKTSMSESVGLQSKEDAQAVIDAYMSSCSIS